MEIKKGDDARKMIEIISQKFEHEKKIREKEMIRNIADDISRKFEIEKRVKEREMIRNGINCICGKCSLPIFFTYDEIEKIIGEFR